ncbi:MAG: RagB/SusD family nutrient uptake outer membrane protein, partial [Bacteroidales bacterium]|nr:RagB/SusD family nutrient uptake outer membrane protein [Bacteroidales bacterium]
YGGNTDQRLLQFFTKESDGKFYTKKFDDRYMNVPVIRLAELYLTRAESQFNINPSDTIILHDINIIRRRADLPDLSSVSSSAIYLERTKELVFEGDNFFNMKRLQKTIAGYDWDDVKLLFKIPQRERDVNPNLTQNE